LKSLAEIYATLRPAGGPWGAAEQVTPTTDVSRRYAHAALDDLLSPFLRIDSPGPSAVPGEDEEVVQVALRL